MSTYTIEVRCVLDDIADMDRDDLAYFGEVAVTGVTYVFTLEAPDRETALDEFHATVPIGCLEDFDVEIDGGDDE